jgi:uncharacterized protein with ParB-like and HNH nuclease domain
LLFGLIECRGSQVPDAPIQGFSKTIYQLFSGASFRMDSYQREFTWERKDVATLIFDLYRSFSSSRKSGDGRKETAAYKPYFLGPYVYVEADDNTVLVDGQQRMTTLHLLLIHLYRLLEEAEERSDATKVAHLISTVNYGETTFTVSVSERRELLEALFHGRRYDLTGNPSPSVRNLASRAHDLVDDFPEDLRGESLLPFTDWLLNRVCLVGIKAESEQHGWEIFVTMNDRGVRLAPIDLLKGHLIEMARQDATDLNTLWREMLSNLSTLGARVPGEFLSTLLLAKYADVGDGAERNAVESTAHEWVRLNADKMALRTAQDYREFLKTVVVKLSQRYQSLVWATEHFIPELSSVYYNAVTGMSKQLMLILAAVNPGDSESDFRNKVKLVASFLDLIYIRRLVNGSISKPADLDVEVYELVPLVRKTPSVGGLRTLLSRRIAELDDEFSGMSKFGLQPDNSRQVRYLLARITAFVEVECDGRDEFPMYVNRERPYEIEHIWANKFERHQVEVKTPQTFKAIRNRLGGLLLLPKSDNASFNADSYVAKLPNYFRQNTLAKSLNKQSRSKFPAYRRFLEKYSLKNLMNYYDEFTKESIEERQRLYIRLCEIIWKPETLGFVVPKTVSPQRRVAHRTRARYDVTISELLTARLLKAGDKLLGRNKGNDYTATIERDGRISIPSGEMFPSPSRAAMFVIDRQSCNGWTFWHLDRDEQDTLHDLRAKLLASGSLERSAQLSIE